HTRGRHTFSSASQNSPSAHSLVLAHGHASPSHAAGGFAPVAGASSHAETPPSATTPSRQNAIHRKTTFSSISIVIVLDPRKACPFKSLPTAARIRPHRPASLQARPRSRGGAPPRLTRPSAGRGGSPGGGRR